MKASLEVLQDGLGRKVAILGDMGELGAREAELHGQVGAFAGGLKLDAVYCTGPLCEQLAGEAKAANPELEVKHFKDRDEMTEQLPKLLQSGDTILVKASHFMQFEKIVELLSGMR